MRGLAAYKLVAYKKLIVAKQYLVSNVALQKIHTPPLLQLEGWSAQRILYSGISKLVSLDAVLEFKNVS